MRSYTTESYRGVSLPILQLNLTWETFAFWKENIKCFFSQSECFLLLSLSLSLKWQCIAPRILTQQEVGRMVAEITPSASLSVARSCAHPSRAVLAFHFIIHLVESETRTNGLESWIDTAVECWGGRNSEQLHATANKNCHPALHARIRITHIWAHSLLTQYHQHLLTLWMASC